MNEWAVENPRALRRDLLTWYDGHRKPLPWRLDGNWRDPYKIFLSEIMSQQTQVATVIPYWERFLADFPTVEALAASDEAAVLKLWEGLGYYSRARHLREAAQQVVRDFGGRFPETVGELRQLVGVGPYTAAAIASISYGAAEPAIDGNLLRVTSRLYALSDDISKASSRKVFDSRLRALIDPARPGDFNQAMMDLGATLCTPKAPDCAACPLSGYCAAYAQGRQEDFPVKSKKGKVRQLYFQAFALQDAEGRYLVVQRPSSGLLADMWTFPMVELAAADSPVALPEALRPLVVRTAACGAITHVFTHLRWRVTLVRCQLADGAEERLDGLSRARWAYSDDGRIAFPGPQRKLFDLLG